MENKNKNRAAEREIEILLGVNPDFHGNRVNPQALAKAKQLMEHAEAIRRINPKVICTFGSFEEKDKPHWSMYMEIPSPFTVMAQAINKRMADMISLTDMMGYVIVKETGYIRFCHTVYDLWRE